MSFTARGYGGYEDVVGSSADSPVTEQPGEDYWNPDRASNEDGSQGSKGGYTKQQEGSPASIVSSTLEQASSILSRIPGAKTVSYANAGIFAGCGVVAALVAWLALMSLLMVLLARWYLPAHESNYTLPLHFDYTAGPAAAVVWVPLLKPSPLADSLSPPAKPYTAAAAGLRGFLTPSSSSSSRRKSSGSGGGRTGLGFSPLSRRGGSGDNATASEGLWAHLSGRARRRRRAAARAAAAATSGVQYDVGTGVSLPDGEWLVPLRGATQLAVELEMPGSPQPDMVQVTGELFTPHGISLGRWTTTWLPKPQPLLFRIASSLALGPWRALGLLDDTTRVDLSLFESFQNPTAPAGGWGSLPGYRRFVQRQQRVMQSYDEFGSDYEEVSAPAGFRKDPKTLGEEEEEGFVQGPRAMWLRVTLSGRSYEAGPPRVYNAHAKLDVDRGMFDRMLASLRPSLATALLVLSVAGAFMMGGAGTAAVLLYVAYVLYRWGNRIGVEQEQQQQQEQYGADGGEVFQQPASYEPWKLDDFVEQEGYGTPLAAGEEGEEVESSGYADDDYTHHLPISEEAEEGDLSDDAAAAAVAAAAAEQELYGSAEHYSDDHSSEELYQEPDYTAGVDELYNSPRALDGNRTRYLFDSGGGSGSSSVRPSFEGGLRQRSSSSRSSSGGLEERERSPAAPAAAAGLPAAGSTAAAAAAAAVAPATPGLGTSRLWSVLGGGHASPAAAPQQQQQQQKQKQQRGWDYGGDEDLPHSLAHHGSSGSSGAAATAAAAAAAAAAAVGQGAAGSGKGSAVGVGAAGEEAGEEAALVRHAAGGGGEVQGEAAGDEEYQEASGEIEALGDAAPVDAAAEPEWRRQLMEDSDDDSTLQLQQQEQQMLKQHIKGDVSGYPPQQQQEGEGEEQSVLLTDKPAAPVKRRFGFMFRS